MSPRPKASRHDPTAIKCLQAAAFLIDSSLDPDGADDPRIRSMRFPASLDWIRIDDVVRVANLRPETRISKKALSNRWDTREAFLQDAVIFALIYADEPIVRLDPSRLLAAGEAASFSEAVAIASDETYQSLLEHPRSFLLCQIAPFFPQHPDLARAIAAEARRERVRWTEVYERVRVAVGLQLRPEWSTERMSLALQCILDGFVVRHRVEPGMIEESRWQQASLYADTVLTFVLGALDLTGTSQTARQRLDAALGGAAAT